MINKMAMFACAAIISLLSLGSVEARPIQKAPSLDAPEAAAPAKLAPKAELPSKEAKCGRHRSHCDKVRVINRVPVTISRSGKYCVNRDLNYDGSGAAITVTADNVTINFANHSLFLTDPAAVGVLATDVEEFTLLNDKISLNQISNLPTSIAIHLLRVEKARIDNVFTENTLRGIRVEGSTGVNITNTHHKNHIGGNEDTTVAAGAGVDIRTSTGVTVDNSYFEGSSGTNHFGNSSINVSASREVNLTNTKHENVDDALFVGSASAGVLVDNLVATFNPESFYAGVSVGAANDTLPSTDIIIRNSTLTNLDAFEGWDGVNIGISSGILFENVIINTNTSVAEDYTPAALHLGCFLINGCDGEGDEKTASNGQYNNLVINNINAYGILIESGVDNVFNNAEVTGASIANIYVDGSYGATIKDSYVGDSTGGDGISVTENATSTTLYENTVTGNATGILIASDASNTIVDSNRAFGNQAGITNNAGSNTVTAYNRVCGNGTNCSGVNPSNTIGDPAEVGENICECFLD